MSMATLPVVEAERHARDYWDVDGLPALVAGGAAVLLGLLLLLGWTLRQTTIGMFAGWVLFAACERSIVEWIKIRVTYRRTGYVARPKDDPPTLEGNSVLTSLRTADTLDAQRRIAANRGWRQRWLPFAAIYLFFGPVAYLLIWRPDFFENGALPLRAAALCLTAFAWNYSGYRIPWLEALGFVLIAVLVAALPGAHTHQFGLLLVTTGILPALRGAVTLRRYLHQNRIPSE